MCRYKALSVLLSISHLLSWKLKFICSKIVTVSISDRFNWIFDLPSTQVFTEHDVIVDW